jgi:iron complex transport system substrate-binding protein
MRELFESGELKYLGNYNAVDLESIIAMKPDLIFATSVSTLELVDFLGFPVMGSYNDTMDDIEKKFQFIEFLGVLYGVKEKAQKRVLQLKDALLAIGEKTKYLPKPQLVWGMYYGKRILILKGNFWLKELIELAGASYVFSDIDSSNLGFSPEEFYMRAKDADFFFVNQPTGAQGIDNKGDIAKWYEELGNMKAFSNEGKVAMTQALLFQDAWNMDEIAMDLTAIIHPELYMERNITYLRILSE